MNYPNIKQGRFLARPNRFVALVELEEKPVTCHVKNTGRCRELLTERAVVYVTESDNPARKTRYDLVAVEKGALLINMDSQAPNRAVEEWLRSGGLFADLTLLKPECRYGNSRFDFYIETPNEKAFLEVKGVTLEENGAALFPDAPTQRGIKHLQELCACQQEGYQAYVIFVVQMLGCQYFAPNMRTHPAFGEALRQAAQCGVHILARECKVTPGSLEIKGALPVCLE